jgi:putative MATE family efflux protein
MNRYIYSIHPITELNKKIKTMKVLWRDIREAVGGTSADFTEGSLKRAIFLLSVPMVLEMVMESVFAVVDIFFVSKLGADAVATVGLTESLITVVYAISMGLSMAASALVSRRIGEKRHGYAARTAFQAILTGLLVSMIIGIPGFMLAPALLRVMGASETIVSDMWGFTALMLGGNSVIMLLFIMNAVFRSAGDAAISMRVLWLANLVNLVLDPMLIFGIGPFPALGVTGAAVATTTGRGLAVLYQIYILLSGKSRIKIRLSDMTIDVRLIGQLLRLSLGGVGQNLIATSSWIGMVRLVSAFGSTVVAGYTIAIRLIGFAMLPSWGISNASATLVGQNLGAQKPDRAERSIWATGKINMVVLGLTGLVFALWPSAFITIFIHDPGVVEAGAAALRIISYGFVAYGLGMVLIQSFNGAGDTLTPMRINLFCFWLLEIPLAYLSALVIGLGEKGVFYSIVIAETSMTMTAWILLRQGKWKLKQV